MPTCSFCKKNYLEPRGLTVFTFDGKSIHFCSSKCRRNMALKRDPKKTNWVRREKKVKKVIKKEKAPAGVPSEEGKEKKIEKVPEKEKEEKKISK